MPNIHSSNLYSRSGYRGLPETFDTDFINHINHGLFDDQLDPAQLFAELHSKYDSVMDSSEVSRHIIHAIQGTEFEGKYSC